MVTNDERRAVAAKLRGMAGRRCFTGTEIERCMGAKEDARGYDDDAQGYMRLADLIEPDRDLTCELELTFAETVRSPVRVYECDHCGKSCDAVWAEDYVYCPYCGRLNEAREVEE